MKIKKTYGYGGGAPPTQGLGWGMVGGWVMGLLMGIVIIGCFYWGRSSSHHHHHNGLATMNWTPNYPYGIGGIGGIGGVEAGFPVSEATFTNPFAPPLRDERYFVPAVPSMRINIPTSGVETNYRQIGILSPLNQPSDKNVLVLMGRPVNSNRQKWQYYSISNQFNGVKLPIRVKGRNATYEYGVDELYSGDNVLVEGNQGLFQVTKYENDVIRYL
jgi:hypothetical protein